jgi:mannose-6-phosphate isomerase-like protein (cupin superfamily)
LERVYEIFKRGAKTNFAGEVSVEKIKKKNIMKEQFNYVTKLDIKFKHLQKIDIPSMVEACEDKWFNQTLSKVNGSVVRLGIVEGEYHWHKHEQDDEFFFVLQGQLFIDLEDRTIELNPNQGVTISKNILHRPRAPQKTVMLMVETCEIQPTGD